MKQINPNKIALLEYLEKNQPVKKSYGEIAEELKLKRKKRIIKYRYVFYKPTRQAIFYLIKELIKEGKIKSEYKVVPM